MYDDTRTEAALDAIGLGVVVQHYIVETMKMGGTLDDAVEVLRRVWPQVEAQIKAALETPAGSPARRR